MSPTVTPTVHSTSRSVATYSQPDEDSQALHYFPSHVSSASTPRAQNSLQDQLLQLPPWAALPHYQPAPLCPMMAQLRIQFSPVTSYARSPQVPSHCKTLTRIISTPTHSLSPPPPPEWQPKHRHPIQPLVTIPLYIWPCSQTEAVTHDQYQSEMEWTTRDLQ